jgi:hypothetical protein
MLQRVRLTKFVDRAFQTVTAQHLFPPANQKQHNSIRFYSSVRLNAEKVMVVFGFKRSRF